MSCGCSLPSVYIPYTAVSAAAASADGYFLALTGPMDTTDLAAVVARVEVLNAASATVKFQVAYQHSNDLSSWTTVSLGSQFDSDGYEDVSSEVSTTSQYVRFGLVIAGNETVVDPALIRMWVEPRSFWTP